MLGDTGGRTGTFWGEIPFGDTGGRTGTFLGEIPFGDTGGRTGTFFREFPFGDGTAKAIFSIFDVHGSRHSLFYDFRPHSHFC